MCEGRLPKRACADCDEEKRREYGCVDETDRQEHWMRLDDGDAIKRCPYALVTAAGLHVVQLSGLIECGVLPDAGGWLDQAAGFCDAAPIALNAQREFAREKRDGDRR